MSLSAADLDHLRRAVDLAHRAVALGDEPFGSVLVSAEGTRLFEDHNRVSGGDHTRHPEFAAARWAAEHLTPQERAAATVYTSGEHCPMCAAAHGWVGLGPVVYATSSAQLTEWLDSWGLPRGPVAALPITDIVPGLNVTGPVPEFVEELQELHYRSRHP
ncbi:MAG TPA: nucleoside deaminase [Actinomycetaceae bacterium]|nr:nucleoside deaminase [Actinomycetaceae bacterium]